MSCLHSPNGPDRCTICNPSGPEVMAVAVADAMTINETRATMGFQPIPDGDVTIGEWSAAAMAVTQGALSPQLGLDYGYPTPRPLNPWYCRKCNTRPRLIMPGDGRPKCADHPYENLVRERSLPLDDAPVICKHGEPEDDCPWCSDSGDAPVVKKAPWDERGWEPK